MAQVSPYIRAWSKMDQGIRYQTMPDDEDAPASPPQLRPSSQHLPSEIGWKSPLLTISIYLAGFFCAAAHYLLFHSLDGVPVDDVTISQSHVSAASVTLTFLFKTCVVSSLWSSFTQWLWHNLRRQETKVSTIEDLIRMPQNPLSLMNWDFLRSMPFLYVCALVTWTVGIVAIFPPGALTVHSQDFYKSMAADVPVFDQEFRGNGTVGEMQKYALFVMGEAGAYFAPRPGISRLAKQTVLSHSPLSAQSPCGQNCSYTVQIVGPAYKCAPGLPSPSSLPALDRQLYYGNQTTYDDAYILVAKWMPFSSYSEQETADEFASTITCAMFSSTYELNVSYKNGIQSVNASSTSKTLLLSSLLNDGELFNPKAIRYPNGTLNSTRAVLTQPVRYPNGTLNPAFTFDLTGSVSYVYDSSTQALVLNDSKVLPGGMTIATAYQFSNVRSMHDAVARALSGGANYVNENLIAENIVKSFWGTSTGNQTTTSLILDSKMANYSFLDPTAVSLNITQANLQDLLTNFTISLLTIPNTNRSVIVSTTTARNVYSFNRPLNLIVAYGFSLLCSLVFVILGLAMIWMNKTVATTGGFLQVLCSTQGSSTLSKLATEESQRGPEHASKDLKDLRIRYGYFRSMKRNGAAMMGFGTREELVPLESVQEDQKGLNTLKPEIPGAAQKYRTRL